jgi:hypothetical protein
MTQTTGDRFDAAVRKRFPDCSEEQIEIAKDRIMRYVQLVIEIYDEAMADPVRRKRMEAYLAEQKTKSGS